MAIIGLRAVSGQFDRTASHARIDTWPRPCRQEKRADYGKAIVSTLSKHLTAEYGRGYTDKGLRRMIQFAERYPDAEIVATLSRQLSWGHLVELIQLDDPL